MNTESLKTLYENTPKPVKRALAPLLVRSMVWNSRYRRMHDEIVAFDRMSPDEQASAHLERLREACIYAQEHTEYYRDLFDSVGFDPHAMTSVDDITVLPLTNKFVCQREGQRMHSDEDIPCYEGHTSGSTGKVFRVLLDRDSILYERAFVNHYQEGYGYDPLRSRTLAIWGHNKDADYYYSPLKNEIVISPFRLFNEPDFDAVWETIEWFRPDVVAGYPSAISVLCDLVRRHGKFLSPRYVLFYGETSTEEDRLKVFETLGCRSITYYGHTERCAFLERREDGYHPNGLYGHVELLPTDDPSSFRIVATGFLSRKMPLIRYATDDYVVVDGEGHMEVRGHTYSEDRVIASNGARIYKGTISPHSGPFEKVRLYQYVQDRPGHVFLDAVMDEPFTDGELRELAAYFDRKCEGLLDVDIRQVDSLRTNARGKYTWLVDEIDHSSYPELGVNVGIRPQEPSVNDVLRLRVAVLVGGWSDERGVSIQSGQACEAALREAGFSSVEMIDVAEDGFLRKLDEGRYDVAFVAMHGRYGEDGCVQGLLEVAGIPYTFSGVLASSVGAAKNAAKAIYREAGIPTPEGRVIKSGTTLSENEVDELLELFGMPLFVKPVGNGSSFGVSKVAESGSLASAIALAGSKGDDVLVERCIEGIEVTVPVLGNEEAKALPIVEIVTGAEFYDTKVKYEPSSLHHVIPARLDGETYARTQELAVRAHRALGCRGASRSDFIVTEDGTPYILETNTIPGMTEASLMPDSARYAGIEFPELCRRLVELAMESRRIKA